MSPQEYADLLETLVDKKQTIDQVLVKYDYDTLRRGYLGLAVRMMQGAWGKSKTFTIMMLRLEQANNARELAAMGVKL